LLFRGTWAHTTKQRRKSVDMLCNNVMQLPF
jgi:hypothetical protein